MNQKDDIQEVLNELNRDCYPLAILRERPLPDGVNPLKLEYYLCDEEFEVGLLVGFEYE
jgi:supervillin